MFRFMFYTLCLITITLFIQRNQHQLHAQSEQRQITPFVTVSDIIESGSIIHDWDFAGEQGERISIVATTVSGDLDLVIELRNSEDRLLAANDNATRETTDARLENLILPNDDNYYIRVYREGLTRQNTNGTYELTLLIGFSQYDDTQPTALTVDATREAAAIIDSDNFFLTARATMPTYSVDYYLEWQFEDITTIAWVFRHNLDGEWSLAVLDGQGEVIRTTTGSDPHLPEADESARFNFLRTNDQFLVSIGDELIANADIVQSLIPTENGIVSIRVDQLDPPLTLINDLRLTTAFYRGEPQNEGALPPVLPDEHLYQYDASPIVVIEELRTLAYAPQPTESSGLQGDIVQSFIANDREGFSQLPIIARPFENFVLSFRSSIITGPANTACGLIFRQTNRSTFATMLYTPEQGLYLQQYVDGRAQADGIATVSPLLNAGFTAENTFTLVVRGEEISVFVNGRFLDSIPALSVPGTVSVHLALPRDSSSYCQLSDVWLWSFD